MRQEVLNNENNKIQYFYKVQRIAEKIQKAYSDEHKCLEKEMRDSDISTKKIQIFEKSKLY